MKTIENNTTKELWEMIEQQLTANINPYENTNAVYEFQLTDEDHGIYQLVLADGTATIYSTSEVDPDCILKMKVKHFREFLFGNLNSTTAFMTGKLKIAGNIGLALKLEKMLKEYDFFSK